MPRDTDSVRPLNPQPATTCSLVAGSRPRVQRDPLEARPPAGGPRAELLLDALPGAVVVLDRDGMVSESNPAAETLFGAAVTGRRWRDVVAAHFVPSSEGGPDACMRDGRRVSIVTRSLGVVPGQILLLTDVTETRETTRPLDSTGMPSAFLPKSSHIAIEVS